MKQASTPYYIFSPAVLKRQYSTLKDVFGECCIAYAVKANPHPEVISQLNALDSHYELASVEELRIVLDSGVSSNRIAFGSATKIPSHIKTFAEKGVKLFAADSIDEVEKIAKFAPKSNIYIRVLVDSDAQSTYTLSKKFGANKNDFIKIATEAKRRELSVVGISFNVGSQAINPNAWGNGINDLHQLLHRALDHKINIQHINIGGGFPIQYHKDQLVPNIKQIAKNVKEQMEKLPYKVGLTIEPGRFLVAESFTAYTSVYSVKKRGDRLWAFIDMGVYNGLFEALACQGSIKHLIQNSTRNDVSDYSQFVIAGPTCDDLDVLNFGTLLPSDTSEGDMLKIINIGAYSIPLSTNFNGFPSPLVYTEVKKS